jgi:SAM-dependent methyltransferase
VVSGAEPKVELINAIREAMQWRIAIPDAAFDQLYRAPVRAMSAVHWTPVAVALRAAEWLTPEPGLRVLDVGSGAGKVCCIGALATEGRWVGVEREPTLVAAADALALKLELGDRVRFVCGDMEQVRWKDFDSLYFYNPFELVLYGGVPAELPHRWALLGNELERVAAALSELPSGTRVVTFHGYGGDMPSGFALAAAERAAAGHLALWIKQTTRRSPSRMIGEPPHGGAP